MGKIDELIQQYCPEGVEFVQIKDIAKCSMGEFVHKSKQDPNAPYPVYNGGITNTGFYKEYNTDENKVIVSARGAGAGFVNVIEQKFWAGNSCHIISVCNADRTNYKYLFYALKNIEEGLIGNQQKGGIPAVSKTQLETTSIPLPPLPVQKEIVRILDSFTNLAAELQAELQARQQQYQYYRDTLLSFEGRDDVQWVKLGDVCAKTDNIKWKTTTGTYQYIDLSSVDIQTHSILSTTPIDKSSAPSRAQQIVRENDVIFATTRPTQMRVCIVPSKYDGEICSTGFCVLRPNKEIVLPQYLFFALAVDDFRAYLSNNLTQGNYPSISNNTLKEYLLPIPSIEEQQHIVDILDRFDTLTNDLSQGLPAEIEARRQQYEYYRDRLLTFNRKEA